MVVDSLCSGAETEAYVLQAAGLITARHRVIVECKTNLGEWFAKQPTRVARPDCHFPCTRTVASSDTAPYCIKHGHRHRIPDTRADLLSTGFVCKPFFDLRAGRFTDGSVETHRDADLFEHVLSYIGTTRPRMIFVENVAGWNKRTRTEREGGHPSAMQNALTNIRDLGYFARALSLDTECWSPVRRNRMYIIAVSKDTASSDAALDSVLGLIDSVVQERSKRPPRDIQWLEQVGPKAWEQDRPLAD